MSVCLCGGMTSPDDPDFYRDDVERFAERLVAQGESVVCGGVTTGIIGQFADVFTAKGGRLEGALIPEEIADRRSDLATVYRFDTYDERQDFMFSASPSVFFLPGGLGTFHEFFSLILKHKMKDPSLPANQTVTLLNWKDFWTPVSSLLGNAYRSGFVELDDILQVAFEEGGTTA